MIMISIWLIAKNAGFHVSLSCPLLIYTNPSILPVLLVPYDCDPGSDLSLCSHFPPIWSDCLLTVLPEIIHSFLVLSQPENPSGSLALATSPLCCASFQLSSTFLCEFRRSALQRCVSHPGVVIKEETTEGISIQRKWQPKVLQEEVLQADMLASEDLPEQRMFSGGTGGTCSSDFGVAKSEHSRWRNTLQGREDKFSKNEVVSGRHLDIALERRTVLESKGVFRFP